MLVYLVKAYNILGIYTQFRHKDMWMTIIFHTYYWKYILNTAISLSSTLIKFNKNSNIYKLYSYSLSSSIILISSLLYY